MHPYSKPVITGIILVVLGTFLVTDLNLYETIPHLDKFFHLAGGLIVAWFFARVWSNKLNLLDRFQYLVVLGALAALVGFLWEALEYSTSVPPLLYQEWLRHYLYIGSIVDTLGDLLADILGAAIFTFLRRR